MESAEESSGLDINKLADMLKDGGAVSKVLAGFEHRPGQVEMLEAVSQVFNSNGILAVEAGTGVGKSLAYGLPAALWAQTEFERVVISSATINLQEQLLKKDLPLVSQVLGRRLSVVLVKGRGNYLCKRRLYEKTRQLTLIDPGESFETLSFLRDWAETSQDGSRSDLPQPISENYWEQVASDGDACLGGRCPHRQECFFVLARQAAEKADVLIVNHHLLFADLALRRALDDWSLRAVLPPFNRLILDEAHELEDAASSFFGVRITRFGVARMLSRMLPSKKKGAGPLAGLAEQLEGGAGRTPDEAKGSVAPLISLTRESYRRAFDKLQALAHKQAGASASGSRLRLVADVFALEEWGRVQESFRKAASDAKELAGQVDKLVGRFADSGEDDDGRLVEVQAWNRRILALAADSEHLISQMPDGFVRWIEGGRKGKKQVSLQSAPLDVSSLMNEALYDQMESVVLTSATLAVRGKFSFLSDRIGLDLQPAERLQTRLVESPFDFAEQVRLALPLDLPAPNQPLYEQVVPEAVYQAAAVSDGRALILFTSWSLMTRVCEMVRDRLEGLGIETLCQGEQTRDRLLNRFRENERSVLFGTDSFWQGVDVVGAALRNVIITRLPFDVPDEPLVQARMESVEQKGQSSFAHFMVPRAVLKLKQGFGRLVRSRADWGSVVVLDNRLLGRSYGQMFIKSLPPATLLHGSLEEVFDKLADFYAGRGGSTAERVVTYDQL